MTRLSLRRKNRKSLNETKNALPPQINKQKTYDANDATLLPAGQRQHSTVQSTYRLTQKEPPTFRPLRISIASSYTRMLLHSVSLLRVCVCVCVRICVCVFCSLSIGVSIDFAPTHTKTQYRLCRIAIRFRFLAQAKV